MRNQEGKSGGYRQIDEAHRNFQHRRRLRPGEHRITGPDPQHEREKAEQQNEDERAQVRGLAREFFLQRVDPDVAAMPQHEARAEEGQPDHQVARHLLHPQDRMVGQKAQRDVGKHHRRHRGQDDDQKRAVGAQEQGVESRHEGAEIPPVGRRAAAILARATRRIRAPVSPGGVRRGCTLRAGPPGTRDTRGRVASIWYKYCLGEVGLPRRLREDVEDDGNR